MYYSIIRMPTQVPYMKDFIALLLLNMQSDEDTFVGIKVSHLLQYLMCQKYCHRQKYFKDNKALGGPQGISKTCPYIVQGFLTLY